MKQSTQTNYDFIGKSKFFGLISVGLVVASLVLLYTRGLNYGIDFAGGTEIQVQFETQPSVTDIRAALNEAGLKTATAQSFGENEFLIRMEGVKASNDDESNRLLTAKISNIKALLNSKFADNKPTLRRVDTVGPQIGDELKRNGLLAAFYSLLIILIYVGLRFDYKFAPGAVLCLFHDAIITLGIFSLFQREVNVQTMAAILTIIGYSLNDTIVNFDRIRENLPKYKKWLLGDVVNRSVNDVLSRTVLTSITTLIAILALYFIGIGVIKELAFTLGIGVVIGTYSSIYVASPLVLFTERIYKKYFESKTSVSNTKAVA